MKKVCTRLLTLLVMLVSVSMARAEWVNYFREGTKWEMFNTALHTGPERTTYVCTVTLEDEQVVDGKTCLVAVHESTLHPGERSKGAYIHVDGDKIYFRLKDDEGGPWYLAYDFGLKPGEGYEAYRITSVVKNKPTSTYMKCLEIKEIDGYEVMTMIECNEEGEPYQPTEADIKLCEVSGQEPFWTVNWIKGIGSTKDWYTPNALIDYLGVPSSHLTDVWADGVSIYSKPYSSVNEVASTDFNVSTDGNDIVLTSVAGGSHVRIYDINGHAVADFTASEPSLRVTAPHSGIYIVNVESKVAKVIIH